MRQSLSPELSAALRTGPFHLALRTAIAERGLALYRLREHLTQRGVRVGLTSLSYWQQGLRRPERADSLRAVVVLEEVLDLPEHSLTRLLGPRRTAEPPDPAAPVTRPFRDLSVSPDAVGELLTEVGGPPEGGLRTVAMLERIRIGPNRCGQRRDAHHVVEAYRDGVDRLLVFYKADPGGDIDDVVLRTEENCRPGRVRRDRTNDLLAAELLLDRRLGRGDTHILRYGFDDAPGTEPAREFIRTFNSGADQYILQVAFDPAALPVRCRRVAFAAPGEAPFEEEELTLDGHHTVHLVVGDLRPSMLSIQWDWD